MVGFRARRKRVSELIDSQRLLCVQNPCKGRFCKRCLVLVRLEDSIPRVMIDVFYAFGERVESLRSIVDSEAILESIYLQRRVQKPTSEQD